MLWLVPATRLIRIKSWAMRRTIGLLMFCSALLAVGLPASAARRVSFVTEGDLGRPGAYGVGKLKETLQAAGLDIANGDSTADLVVLANVPSRCADTPRAPESLSVHRGTQNGKPAVILCGADSRGLMYAALDTADRIRWSRPVRQSVRANSRHGREALHRAIAPSRFTQCSAPSSRAASTTRHTGSVISTCWRRTASTASS